MSGNEASGAGLGQDMPNIPLTLWLGGVQAPVVYRGRSGCCIGEDQIAFTVPKNVPTGCAVPLLIQIGNQVSNATVMAIASGLTSAIVDPLDKELMDAMITAELVLNKNIYCDSFLDAYRKK